MPVSIKKTDGKYRVSTPHGVKSKGSTLKNAMAQKRLLNAVEHGWRPTGKPSQMAMRKHVMKMRVKKK